jgi:hypothetical protein
MRSYPYQVFNHQTPINILSLINDVLNISWSLVFHSELTKFALDVGFRWY